MFSVYFFHTVDVENVVVPSVDSNRNWSVYVFHPTVSFSLSCCSVVVFVVFADGVVVVVWYPFVGVWLTIATNTDIFSMLFWPTCNDLVLFQIHHRHPYLSKVPTRPPFHSLQRVLPSLLKYTAAIDW